MLQNFLQNMQNQANAKHFSDSEDILKSTKTVSEKLNTEEKSFNTTTSIVLSKIRQNCMAKISLEVHGV